MSKMVQKCFADLPPLFLPHRCLLLLCVLHSGGVLALASCSSHINFALFHQICDAAIARARRTAVVLGVHGQPADHPYASVCTELRYLKFVTHCLD